MASLTAGLGYIYNNINLTQSTASVEALNDIILPNSAVAGETVTRSLVPTERIVKIFNVVHAALETTQKEWVENFYAVNRDSLFDFQWKADGYIYRVKFTKPPKSTIITTGWWKVELILQEISTAEQGGVDAEVINPDLAIPTMLVVLMDIPLLNAGHSELGFYWAVTPLTVGSFVSSTLKRATTAGTAYSSLAVTTSFSVIGTAESIIGDFYGGNIFDELNKVTIKLYNINGDKTLAGAAETAVLAGTNLAMLGAEIISFKKALYIGDSTYVLTGLLRGRGGTEWTMGTHVADEQFVLLDGTVGRYTDICANIDTAYDFKASSDDNLDYATAKTFTNTGISAKPLSPVFLAGGILNVSEDVSIKWVRRARINAWWGNIVDVPLDEPVEVYKVRIGDSPGYYTSTIRTFTVTSATSVTYTNAQMFADYFPIPTTIYFSVTQQTGDDPVCIPEGYSGYGSFTLPA
jgi:hypothetical protein